MAISVISVIVSPGRLSSGDTMVCWSFRRRRRRRVRRRRRRVREILVVSALEITILFRSISYLVCNLGAARAQRLSILGMIALSLIDKIINLLKNIKIFL